MSSAECACEVSGTRPGTCDICIGRCRDEMAKRGPPLHEKIRHARPRKKTFDVRQLAFWLITPQPTPRKTDQAA